MPRSHHKTSDEESRLRYDGFQQGMTTKRSPSTTVRRNDADERHQNKPNSVVGFMMTSKEDIPVLYEDDDCIVFNKPSGLLTIPTDKGPERNCVDLVNAEQETEVYLHPAHRLDRDTSGVILFAKGKENQQILMQSFKEKNVHKNYIAFVHGHLKPEIGKIRIPVKDYHQRKFLPNAPAQSALTHYKVSHYHKDFTVVDVMPITGRTNQIRIHFAKIKYPLVGEDKYAFRKDFALRFRRTALHAARLEWPHPVTKKMIAVEAPMPADMANFLTTHQ